jgi:MFS family permease
VTAGSSPGERVSVFGRRDFRLYFVALFLAGLAIEAQSVAVSWQVYDLVRSPIALGYVGLSQFLPLVIFVLPAGDIADRFDRRMILAISFFVQAVCAGLFLYLTITQESRISVFYLVLALFGIARAFAQPAAQSFLPLLVPQDQFPEAVAWTSSARQTAVIAGPALGGVIYALGPAVAYLTCFAMLLAVAGELAAVRTRSSPELLDPEVTTYARLTAGIRYVRNRPIILGAISLDLFAVLLGGATALLPIYARDILRVGPAGLGLLRSAPAVGAASLGLMLVRMPLRKNSGLKMFAAVAVFGIATIVFGLSRNFILSLATLVVLGASDMVSVYVRHNLVQLATPDAMRGRVSAVNFLFIGASNELGEFESGVTAALLTTVPAVVLGGVGTLAIVGIWMWLFPDLRKVDSLFEVTPA